MNHYYWTPNLEAWPSSATDLRGSFYGPYFAYLMRRHQLRNVYITNLVSELFGDVRKRKVRAVEEIGVLGGRPRNLKSRPLRFNLYCFLPTAVSTFPGFVSMTLISVPAATITKSEVSPSANVKEPVQSESIV